MNNIQEANHGFTYSEMQGAVLFTYQQEKYQTKNLLPIGCLLPIIIAVLLALIKPSSVVTGVIYSVIIAAVFFQLIKYLMNLSRKQKYFSVDREGFDVNDKRYLRKDITSMFIQQGNSQPIANVSMNQSTGAFIAYPANAGGMMAASATNAMHAVGQVGNAAAQKFRDNVSKLNCKLFIRYGNKNVVLADGMTFDTAEVMMDKIVEITSSLK